MFSPRMPAGIRNGMRASGVFPGNVSVAGTFDAAKILIAGGTAAAADAGADDLVIGAGNGDYGLTGNVGATGLFKISVSDGTNDRDGEMEYSASASRWLFRAGNGSRVRLGTADMRPNSAGAMDLGTTGVPWGSGYFEDAIYPGDTAGHGPGLWAGSGAPGAGLGANGDFYFRSDGVVASSPVIYHKESGSWVTVV